MQKAHSCVATLAGLVLAVGARADEASRLGLDLTAGVREEVRASVQPEGPPAEEQPAADASVQPTVPPHTSPRFGRAGTQWVTVGAGYMHDLRDSQGGEIHLSYSRFLVDELEFALELGGWYFDQKGDNTGGISPTMNFRWHFLHDEAYTWTVFGEVGIGMLFTADEVPDGGTGFNFVPRAGGGFTRALSDTGVRLQMGLRWQHISNGRIEGNERNPGRESIMVFAGVMVPF